MTPATEKTIDAAEKYAESYKGDPRPAIETDVMNAFYAGAAFAAEQGRFRHRKTGGVYRLLHEGLREADMEPMVIYKGDDGRIWVRPKAEFFDGRFEEVSA